MMVRYRFWMTLLIALLVDSVIWAGGIANRHSNGALTDVGGGNQCVVDSVVSSLPATITSTLVGNDCGLRAFADRTYQIHLTQPGSYSFVVTGQLDTYMAIMTGCCAGDVIVWNDDDEAGIPNGPSALRCITLAAGDYYVVIEAKNSQGTGASFTLDIRECSDPCDDAFRRSGDFSIPGSNARLYVQTVDSTSHQDYSGPFTNPYPCQGGVHTYGFDYLSWYDEDFGWQHSFSPSTTDTSAHPCVESAILYICAWDVDINGCDQPTSDLATCERDRVYLNGSPVATGFQYLTGLNYANSVSGFTLPPATVMSGPLHVWVDIDEYSPSCNWATNIHRSQLQVIYRWNHRPYPPTATATTCVTPNSPMCVTITGPETADPDHDAVQCCYRWYRFDGQSQTWTFTGDTTACAAPGTYSVGEQWKVEVRCKDACGLVSQPYTHEFTIVASCNDNPQVGWDLGDLGGCYPTGSQLTGGPANPVWQHNIAWLGPTVTPETSPNIPNLDSGDDGVEFLNRIAGWHPCLQERVVVTISTNPPWYTGQPLYLYAWKDGDTNCHFGDMLCDGQASECFIHARPETAGPDTISFTDPGVPSTRPYKGVFRFRLLSSQMNCDSALTYIDPLLGETEDYVISDLQLAVQMLHFTATSEGHAIVLSWATASEQSNDHFVLERRSSGNWQNIVLIHAAGTSSTQRNYQYRDEDVEVGNVYEYRLVAVNVSDEQQIVAATRVAETEQNGQPADDYRLYANYPNPFNPTTTISFDMKEAGYVRLSVFDVTGRLVAKLVNGYAKAGHHREVFDARNLPSGLYFYRLETPQFTDMKKMILLK